MVQNDAFPYADETAAKSDISIGADVDEETNSEAKAGGEKCVHDRLGKFG
jgi:hypothetical protein